VNDDRTHVAETVRNALRDAADHAALRSPVPVVDVPKRVRTGRPRGRTRALVAVCVLAIGVATIVGVVALSRDDGSVRIAAPIGAAREVPVEQLPRSATNLFVYFLLDATDEQVASVRTALDTSPDVVHYAWLDHDAAQRDFAELYACRPDLVDSVSAKNLPVSFRVSTTDADAATRVQIALGSAPGVQLLDTSTETYGIPARSDQTVTPVHRSPCDGAGDVVQTEP
jgi:FtsX extracellular domain